MLDYRTQKIDFPAAETTVKTSPSLAARVEKNCDQQVQALRKGSSKLARLTALLAAEREGRSCATELIKQVRLDAAQRDPAMQKGPDLRPALL